MIPQDQADRTEGVSGVSVLPSATVSMADIVRQKVLIVMPWLKHTNPMTAYSVMGLLDKRRTATLLNFGDAFVAHSRNRAADLFLKTDLDWSLWIDDDMIVPFGNAKWFNAYTGFNLAEPFASMNSIDRLLSHGKTLIGGLYFGRHSRGKPMYSEGCVNEQEASFSRTAPRNVIKPTRWVATGCMLIHRSVFLDIEKKYPRLARKPDGMGGNWFTSTEHTLLERVDRAMKALVQAKPEALAAFKELEAGMFEAQRDNALGTGEDVAFCLRATQAGHQPFVDLGLVCGHVGHTVFGPGNTGKP